MKYQNSGPSATLTHGGKKKRERMKMLYKKQFRDVLETEKDTMKTFVNEQNFVRFPKIEDFPV